MKKKALIFSTLGASLLLAGGVFAAYTVTDSAEKIGIKISPTTIDDDKTGTVTLTWDEAHNTANFTDIEDVSITHSVARSVKLVATTTDEEDQVEAAKTYTGKFTAELQQLTQKATEAKKLVNYLHVDVKVGEASAGSFGLVSGEANPVLTYNRNIETTKDGSVVTMTVSIDPSAQPIIDQIEDDQVYLSVDWSRGEETAGVTRVYIPAPSGWTDMFVYSYGASGQNADWPGVALNQDGETGFYIADLQNDHTNFIFSSTSGERYPGAGEPGATKTSLAFDSTHIYFDWEEHTFVTEAPESTFPFYLVGEATESWTKLAENGLVLSDTDKPEGSIHQYKGEVTVVANKEYKIRPLNDGAWHGYSEVEAGQSKGYLTEGEDNNFKFNAAGTYEVYLKQYSEYWSVYLNKLS